MTTVYLVQRIPVMSVTQTHLYATFSRERAMFLLEKERAARNDLANFIQITEITADGPREDEAERMYNAGYQCWNASMDYKGAVFFLEKEMNTSAVTLPTFNKYPAYGENGSGKRTFHLYCRCWAKDGTEAVAIMDKERIRRINEGEWKE
jgi:hypothetical protein